MIIKKILEFGLSRGYFNKKPIKSIEKSCCSLGYEIIDFDDTKETICQVADQQTRKSCDGLCLKKSINFIEFKSLNNFFDKEFSYKLRQEELENIEIIKKKVKDFNFKRKITDSLWLLDYIVRHRDLSLSNNEIGGYERTEKNYYIVKDKQLPLINILFKLNWSANENISLYYEVMNIEIKTDLNSLTQIEINRPKLIDCSELEKILKDLDEQTDYI